MRTTLFTKDVSVERVTPPALLGNCKAVGKSEREVRCQYPKPPLCSATFDLEDAIEHLLGERVYQRL